MAFSEGLDFVPKNVVEKVPVGISSKRMVSSRRQRSRSKMLDPKIQQDGVGHAHGRLTRMDQFESRLSWYLLADHRLGVRDLVL